MMVSRWITQIDGTLVRVWEPEYREDVTFADVDHPYGTCGSTSGHEGHWTPPYTPKNELTSSLSSAAVQETTAVAAKKWTPQGSVESKEAA